MRQVSIVSKHDGDIDARHDWQRRDWISMIDDSAMRICTLPGKCFTNKFSGRSERNFVDSLYDVGLNIQLT